FVLTCPRTTGKITGNGAQADFLRGWGLAHSDATVATCLMDAGASVYQVEQVAISNQILQDLPRSWIDIQGDTIMNSFPLDYFGHHREIPVARVSGRTDICLINLSA